MSFYTQLRDKPLPKNFADPSLISQSLHHPFRTPVWITLCSRMGVRTFIPNGLSMPISEPLELGCKLGIFYFPQFFRNRHQISRHTATMLTQLPNAEIIPLAKNSLGADELKITPIRDDSISSLPDLQKAAEPSESHVPQPYWFRCPECNFDWREWRKPSITFVSLSFVIDTCPNCGRKYVTACRMGSIKARE